MIPKSQKEFTYGRIDMDRPSIRLIRLLRGTATTISCELFEAYLDDSSMDGIPYEALSYTWGTLDKTATVQINGTKAKVTENLFMALQHLCLMDDDRILWIDAICIDQGNDKERGHQVQQMGDIYHKAERVIVWLGTATEETDSLMRFLTKLPANRGLVPEAVRTQQYDLLKKLLDRQWFKRVWIIQEVAKAQRAIVVCGWKSISTRVLTKAPSVLGLEPNHPSRAVLDVMPGHLRASSWFEQQPTLCTLLQKFHASEASDERDMIYALLGMSSSAHERSRLQADYELDLKVLIRRTISTLLFPTLRVPPDLHFIDWSWHEFVRHLKALRFNVLVCAIENRLPLEGLVDNSLDGPKWELRYKNKYDRTARDGHDSVVTLLLEQDNIDISPQDDFRVSALCYAARHGHEDIVRLLLEQNDIEINAQDSSGATALRNAARRGHVDVVRLLLEHENIDINAQNESATTALCHAARNGHDSVVRLLLKQNSIDINKEDKSGMTALCHAAKDGYDRIVRLLLEHGDVDINTGVLAQTPVWLAARHGRSIIFKLLIKRGDVDTKAQNENGETLLWTAASKGHKDICKLLIERGDVDINAQNNDAETPLWVAARGGHTNIVRMLLEQGEVNTNARDRNGRTAEELSFARGYSDIVLLIYKRRRSDLQNKGSWTFYCTAM